MNSCCKTAQCVFHLLCWKCFMLGCLEYFEDILTCRHQTIYDWMHFNKQIQSCFSSHKKSPWNDGFLLWVWWWGCSVPVPARPFFFRFLSFNLVFFSWMESKQDLALYVKLSHLLKKEKVENCWRYNFPSGRQRSHLSPPSFLQSLPAWERSVRRSSRSCKAVFVFILGGSCIAVIHKRSFAILKCTFCFSLFLFLSEFTWKQSRTLPKSNTCDKDITTQWLRLINSIILLYNKVCKKRKPCKVCTCMNKFGKHW